MKILPLAALLVMSGALAACGSSSNNEPPVNGSSSSAASDDSSSSATSSSSSSSVAAGGCQDTSLYFCEDFSGDVDRWAFLSQGTNEEPAPNGQFDLADDNGNTVLRFTAANRGGELALVRPEAFAEVPSADYFVEARIRPRDNSTTGNKFLYLMARYESEGNWLAAGLNVQNTTDATRVEIARSVDGDISRPVQISRPIIQGPRDTLEGGQWYTVRFELVGPDLTVYFDGEPVGSTTDTLYTERGLIGLFTSNKSFEIDDIRVGDPADKPTQLTLDPPGLTWVAEAETDPYVVTVTAIQGNGEPDTFSVESDDPAIVGVSVEGTQVSLAPLTEGETRITFTSGSEPALKRVLEASIGPAFAQPKATYALSGRVVPALNAENVHTDTRLRLSFDAPPSLADVGSIRIYRADDDEVIDSISLTGEQDSLPGSDRDRVINTEPVWVDGNDLMIAPHSDALAPETHYYVAIAPDAVNGEVGGVLFEGMGRAAGWFFTTGANDVSGNEVTVAAEGEADFRTVQGALSYAMRNLGRDEETLITIADGVYREPLYLRNKNNLTLRGQSRDGVVIKYRNNEALNSGTAGRANFLVESADMLTLEDLTFVNTTLIGEGGQAEALYFNSQGRMIANRVSFFSEQDTIQVKGYTWFYDSLIAGNVDYIWGGNRVALFEESEIRTLGRSSGSGGYILQARTVEAADKGFVFLNSELTRGPGPTGTAVPNNSIPLARSGGSENYFDNVVFINTRMDSHITSSGWHTSPTPNPAVATATSGWREYNSQNLAGEPINTSNWVSYSLSEEEYSNGFSNRAQIFAGYNNGEGWKPQP